MHRLVIVQVVEKGTGEPVPWFGVEVSSRWGRSSSPDPNVTISPDALRRVLRHEFDGGAGFTTDGRLLQAVRLVAGADNHLRITVSGTQGIDEDLPVPTTHGTTMRRRCELDFEGAGSTSGMGPSRARAAVSLEVAGICDPRCIPAAECGVIPSTRHVPARPARRRTRRQRRRAA